MYADTLVETSNSSSSLDLCDLHSHYTLSDESSFVIPCASNLTEVKSFMVSENSRMAFIVTSVLCLTISYEPSRNHTFTFVNNVFINCLSTENVPYKGICYKNSQF